MQVIPIRVIVNRVSTLNVQDVPVCGTGAEVRVIHRLPHRQLRPVANVIRRDPVFELRFFGPLPGIHVICVVARKDVVVHDLVWNVPSPAVVDKHRGVAGEHIVRVDVSHGQVVCGTSPGGAPVETIDAEDGRSTGEKLITHGQVPRLLPLAVGVLPDRVILGSGESVTRAEVQIDQ